MEITVQLLKLRGNWMVTTTNTPGKHNKNNNNKNYNKKTTFANILIYKEAINLKGTTNLKKDVNLD